MVCPRAATSTRYVLYSHVAKAGGICIGRHVIMQVAELTKKPALLLFRLKSDFMSARSLPEVHSSHTWPFWSTTAINQVI